MVNACAKLRHLDPKLLDLGVWLAALLFLILGWASG
jgi:hypothetical protein